MLIFLKNPDEIPASLLHFCGMLERMYMYGEAVWRRKRWMVVLWHPELQPSMDHSKGIRKISENNSHFVLKIGLRRIVYSATLKYLNSLPLFFYFLYFFFFIFFSFLVYFFSF